MKKLFNYIFLLLTVVAFSLTSCDEPNYKGETDETGSLSTQKLTVDVDDSEIIVTKASTIVDVNSFNVRIYNAQNVLVNEWRYGTMPGVITLPVGTYSLEVYNNAVQEAAFDAPYYYATKSFTIKKNEITEIGAVTCTLQNVKVSIAYSDELKAVMGSDVKVNVAVADRNNLDFVADETRAGFFRYYENNTTLVATFSGTVAGAYIAESHKIITNVAPGKHYRITFTYKATPSQSQETGSFGVSNIRIDADVTIVNVTRSITVTDPIIDPFDYLTVSASSLNFACAAQSKNVTVKASSAWTVESDQEWCTVTPNEGGFTVAVEANDATEERHATINVTMGNLAKAITVTQAEYSNIGAAPSFESEFIDLTGAYNDYSAFDASHPAAVTILAPNGVKSFHVTINSQALSQEELQSVGLDSTFDLATGRADDGTDLTGALAGLGFPVATGGTKSDGTPYLPVVDQTELQFDITQFLGLLAALGEGNHDFVLTVTDNADLTSEVTIKISVIKH